MVNNFQLFMGKEKVPGMDICIVDTTRLVTIDAGRLGPSMSKQGPLEKDL